MIQTLRGLTAGQRSLLRILRQRGTASRAELSAACGVTPAAVSVMTRDLLSTGLVVEGARRHGGRGAPQIDLSLSAEIGVALGIHATRHVISLSLLDFAGRARAETSVTGDFRTFPAVCAAIADGLGTLRHQSRNDRPLIGAGLAMPTRFHSRMTGLDLAKEVTSWGGEGLVEGLEAALHCRVVVENDANAAAIGEIALGNPSGHRDFAYLYLSEGIGGALILNGALYRGPFGNAGEFGALRPRGRPRPSFEDLAHFCEAEGPAPPSGRDPGQWGRYIADNPAVIDRWLDRAVPEVAHLVFSVTALLAPMAVCLGGTLPLPIVRAFRDRIDLTRRDLFDGGSVIPPALVLPAVAAQDAVAFGAAVGALELHG
ncbi:ROK family transcriptional regulator [Falsirhodobacter halotolerans]|uniref:ROK family transcriptional regulator n=1 Tax=Falsirhodobacter halotolerans TaxID=1146892 RepID=UPI001FD360A7|nr:ROK family transcriptional regulator [Falsirhodobacter halotolerans]MCJ8140841.1 ROK family transcriptional regulator [Falsirhodobacter halotolerans]